MSNYSYIIEYKQKIINMLLKDANLVKLINPKPNANVDIVDVLLGGSWIVNGKKVEEQGHIFDYNFVDETISDEKTFMFIETDIEYMKNSFFTDFNIYVYIFSSKNLIKLTNSSVPTVSDVRAMGYNVSRYANRIDIMVDIVDKILCGNHKIQGIGVVKPAERWPCAVYYPSTKYYGKCLKYHITNLYESGEHCEDN